MSSVSLAPLHGSTGATVHINRPNQVLLYTSINTQANKNVLSIFLANTNELIKSYYRISSNSIQDLSNTLIPHIAKAEFR